MVCKKYYTGLRTFINMSDARCNLISTTCKKEKKKKRRKKASVSDKRLVFCKGVLIGSRSVLFRFKLVYLYVRYFGAIFKAYTSPIHCLLFSKC